ncbi:25348_t:CDS:10, partial [Dentiscutata erythropus]
LGEYRSLNGTNNDKNNTGAANMSFVRDKMKQYYYANNSTFAMISTPVPTTNITCIDTLQPSNFPLPRCVSNKIHSFQLKPQDSYNLTLLNHFKSKRRVSHIVSNALKPDIGPNESIYIPADDNNYQSQNNYYQGRNQGTPFLDASHIYEVEDWKLQMIRDYGNKGKMKLNTSGISDDYAFGYPPRTYGVPLLASSIALDVQDEVDIFICDQMRNFMYRSELIDVASFDIFRARDHGILLYNDAREVFNLCRAKNWSDISSDPVTQQRLQDTYGYVNLVEVFPGGLAEDHVNDQILAHYFLLAIRIRYESPEAGFTQDEINLIHNTTLAMVISRNIPATANLPSNIWIVQPAAIPNVTTTDNSYPQFNVLKFSNTYQAQWRIDGSDIYFLITLQSSNGWCGIGFNPTDNGMTNADMTIISVNSTDSSGIYVGVYKSTGYQRPTKDDSAKFLTIIITDGFTQVEFKRPLSAPNRKPITASSIKISIWIVRYMRHRDTYMFKHRNLQILGAICVGIFGAVAMSSVTIQFRVPHGILGTTVYTILVVQVGLGL